MPRERHRRQYGTGSVYQRKDGRWVGTIEAGYTTTGARRRITVTAATQAEAKRKLKLRARELDRDKSAGQTSPRKTVKAWADTWLERTERTATPNAHTVDRAAVHQWIVPTIGQRRLVDLTPGDVHSVTQAIRDAGRSSTTVRTYHGTLNRLLKAARVEGYDVPGRVLDVERAKPAAHDRQAIAIGDVLAMLRSAADLPHGSRWLAAFLQGLRQGECLGLTWDEVDEETLTVSWQLQPLPYKVPRDRSSGFRIPDGYEARQLAGALHLVRPKSQAGWRTIPLIPAMAAAMDHWRSITPASPHGLVWPTPTGAPRDEVDDRAEWYRLQDANSIRHPSGRRYYLHESRNTTATLLASLEVPESVRIAILGHTSIKTTRGYETFDRRLAYEALSRLGQTLELEG